MSVWLKKGVFFPSRGPPPFVEMGEADCDQGLLQDATSLLGRLVRPFALTDLLDIGFPLFFSRVGRDLLAEIKY